MKRNLFETPITRRSLIGGLSSSALLLTAHPLERALAEISDVYAKRFVNFFVGNGMVPAYFYPNNGSSDIVAPLTEDLFSFNNNGFEVRKAAGYSLNPILTNGLRDKTTIIQGVHFKL